MGYQNHAGTYVKILNGKHAGEYGRAGWSSSDSDLIEVYPINGMFRVLLDVFNDIEVIKCPAQIRVIKLMYERLKDAK